MLDALLDCYAGDSLLELYGALLEALLDCCARDSLLELCGALLDALLIQFKLGYEPFGQW